MAARTQWLLLCLLGCVAKSRSEPIVSTDIVYSTYGLLSEVCSTAYDKAGVDALLKKIPWDETIGKVWEKVPPEAQTQISELSTKAIQVKATVQTQIGAAYAPLEAYAEKLLGMIVSLAPSMSGKIGKGPGNLAIFILYVCVLGFVALTVAKLVLRLVLKVFCCICCCGCCRSSKPKAEAAPKAEAKGKAKKK